METKAESSIWPRFGGAAEAAAHDALTIETMIRQSRGPWPLAVNGDSDKASNGA